jgi:RNA polymerase sigma-70 factor (ECF subfamily)
MLEDELLKLRFRRGSRDALCRIYEKYQDYLLTLAMALLNNVESAEDVVHDVFVSFAKSAENFRLRGSLKGYLATCVINRARDEIKRGLRRTVTPDESGLLTTESDGPDRQLIFDEESKLLAGAVAALPYEQREVIMLRVKGGMRFKEVAKLQGCSVNTVQGRYRYGLDKLRSILNGMVEK